MKKRFLSVIVLSAALFSVQAQEGKGGISPEMLGQIKQSYQGTAADKALRNAIGNNDIRKLALNQENMQGMDTHFSIKVESKGITDQKSSGRCWLFTGLNVMRAKTLAEYGFQSFEFSEVYPFFWDQLEKANLFLQGIIDTSKSPLTDKTVEWLFQHPLSDGGTFTGVADIVSKYGLVPKDALLAQPGIVMGNRHCGLHVRLVAGLGIPRGIGLVHSPSLRIGLRACGQRDRRYGLYPMVYRVVHQEKEGLTDGLGRVVQLPGDRGRPDRPVELAGRAPAAPEKETIGKRRRVPPDGRA